MKTIPRFRILGVLGIFFLGCAGDNLKKRYILAEKLWQNHEYASAVSEFDKVARKDPKGLIGLQSLYRSAMTEGLFLHQYVDAVKKLRTYLSIQPQGPESKNAQVYLADILFSKLNLYDQAVVQYQELVHQYPKDPNEPEYEYRTAKSYFFLWQFDRAIAKYQEIDRKFKGSLWAEKAALEIGQTLFTASEQYQNVEKGQSAESYHRAMQAYEEFLEKYPKSRYAAEAKFGVAGCLEEMDQLEAAFDKYATLQKEYPSPSVIRIKMLRIRERINQRRRS